MPKNRSKASWIREWINRINGDAIYNTDGRVVFCNPCDKQVFAGVRNQMDSAIGEKADMFRQKFADLVMKYSGIDSVIQMCQILSGENCDCDISPALIPFYKFTPLTSCDVERSFSTFKSILADNRMSFTPENLEMYLICNCYMKN